MGDYCSGGGNGTTRPQGPFVPDEYDDEEITALDEAAAKYNEDQKEVSKVRRELDRLIDNSGM